MTAGLALIGAAVTVLGALVLSVGGPFGNTGWHDPVKAAGDLLFGAGILAVVVAALITGVRMMTA